MNVFENYIRRRARLYSFLMQVGCGKVTKNCYRLKWTLILFFSLLALTWLYLSAYVICGVGFDAMVGPHFDNCPHIDNVPRLLHYHQLVPKADWTSHTYLDTWTDLQNVAATFYLFDNAAAENEMEHVRLAPNAFTSPYKGKLLARIKVVNGTQYVLSRRPLLAPVWANLSRNERSHFLRYLNIEADGGLYADPNVRLRVMVEDWLRRYQFDAVDEAEEMASDGAAAKSQPVRGKRGQAAASQAIMGGVLMRGAEVSASEARFYAESESPASNSGQPATTVNANNRQENALVQKPEEILRTNAPSLPTPPLPSNDQVAPVPEATAVPIAHEVEVAPPLVPTEEPTDHVGSMDFILGFAQDTAYEYPCPPEQSDVSANSPSDPNKTAVANATCRLPFLLCLSTFAGRQGSRLFSHVREAVEQHILKYPQRSQSYQDESLKTGEVIFTRIVLDEIARYVYDKPHGKTTDGIPIAFGDNLLAIHRRGMRLSLRYGDGQIVRGVILPRRAFADPGRMEKDYLVLKMKGSGTEPPYFGALLSY